MAALPPESTARLRLNYSGWSGDHTTIVRVASGLSDGAYINIAQQAANAFARVQYSSAVWGEVELIEQGSNVAWAIGSIAIEGYVQGNPAPQFFPAFISFGGKSRDGKLVDWEIYEPAILPDDNYRVRETEDPRVLAVYNSLKSMGTNVTTISGGAIRYRNYANTGYNAYHQREARKTA